MTDLADLVRGLPAELQPSVPDWACMTPERLAHTARVADLVLTWAEELDLEDAERDRWLRAVWLHDALRDAPDELIATLTTEADGPPALRHGPAAAARVAADGETDRSVLDAVRYHSLGYVGWDMVGRVLYCADFLEPGRTFDPEGRAHLARWFPEAPEDVVFAVAQRRVAHLVRSGWPILEPTATFWNSLTGSPPS